jgi:RNA polymerase sigma factor (sigma-70 family)
VESSEHRTGGSNPAVVEPVSEDAALAAACQSGDLHGYERLYAMYGARMKNLARNVLGNSVDAEDAVQETFLKVQRSIASFRGQSSFVTWTYRILINTCYDARRGRLRKKEVANDDSEETPRMEPRAPGAHPSLRMALECFSLVRSRGVPPRGDRGNAGNYGDGIEKHAVSGEKKPSPDA